MRGCQETACARLMIDLIGLPRQSALIYYAHYAHVPAVLVRFTRFAPDLDEDMKTTRDRVFV